LLPQPYLDRYAVTAVSSSTISIHPLRVDEHEFVSGAGTMALKLKEESWIWYALAVSMVACRVLSRTIFFGNLKHLKTDDWLMVLTTVPYTVMLVVINIVNHTSSNLLEPGSDIATMSQSQRNERIYGSKLILVVEQMQLATIWLVKGCLIILYYRLTYERIVPCKSLEHG
jgi:hypothetical protein